MRIHQHDATFMLDKDRAAGRSLRGQVKKFLSLLAFRDVHRHTKKPRWLAIFLREIPTASPNPADRSVRQHDAILSFVTATSSYRSPHGPIPACSIVRVHTFLELTVRNLIVGR